MKETQQDDIDVTYNLWDTSSTELDMKILPSQIYKSANSFLICCSYDNLQSIDNIANWIDHIKRYSVAQNGTLSIKVPIFILFNKYDVNAKVVKTKDIRVKLIQLIQQYDEENIYVVEKVSAKDDLNLKNIFKATVEHAVLGYIKSDDYVYSTNGFSSKRRSFRLDTSISSAAGENKKSKCCN
jgi:hypothetical protein